jgi:hypothetical protein
MGAIFYGIFASAELQEWAQVERKNDDCDENECEVQKSSL